MSQKEFSQRTGIAESAISDWKKKNNNPVLDKVLIIFEVLGVTPYELLSGAEGKGTRSQTIRCMACKESGDSISRISLKADTLFGILCEFPKLDKMCGIIGNAFQNYTSKKCGEMACRMRFYMIFC